MNTEPLQETPPQKERRRSPLKIVLLVVAIAIVTSVITVWLTLTYLFPREFKPVMLKGVSLWGVPIPNAWLGGIKNVDLVEKFGDESGFWELFAAGVENIRVEEGNLSIKLKE